MRRNSHAGAERRRPLSHTPTIQTWCRHRRQESYRCSSHQADTRRICSPWDSTSDSSPSTQHPSTPRDQSCSHSQSRPTILHSSDSTLLERAFDPPILLGHAQLRTTVDSLSDSLSFLLILPPRAPTRHHLLPILSILSILPLQFRFVPPFHLLLSPLHQIFRSSSTARQSSQLHHQLHHHHHQRWRTTKKPLRREAPPRRRALGAKDQQHQDSRRQYSSCHVDISSMPQSQEWVHTHEQHLIHHTKNTKESSACRHIFLIRSSSS